MGVLQYFCRHKWNSITKETDTTIVDEIVEGTEHWIKPKFQKLTYIDFTEVLICEKCGKIEIINY